MNLAAWIPLFAVGIAFTASMLWHLATHEVGFMSKTAWALIIVLLIPLGALIYLLVGVLGMGTQRPDAEGRLDSPSSDESS